MITQQELRRIDELRSKRTQVSALLDSFTSKNVWARVGIVEINGASPDCPNKLSDRSRFFHNEMKETVTELSEQVISKLKHRLKEIDLELSRYVADSPSTC